MALFIAYNAALSTTTNVGAGTSYATGAKLAIQLQIPDNGAIEIVEWGWSQDVATATATLLEIASTDTASTCSTAHTTTTVEAVQNYRDAIDSRLTFGATTNTGYGNGSITSNTTLRNCAHLYVPQTYVQQYPLGGWPKFGSGTAENYVQMRVNTTATVNALAWIMWNEII
jgi:hypothetical protein